MPERCRVARLTRLGAVLPADEHHDQLRGSASARAATVSEIRRPPIQGGTPGLLRRPLEEDPGALRRKDQGRPRQEQARLTANLPRDRVEDNNKRTVSVEERDPAGVPRIASAPAHRQRAVIFAGKQADKVPDTGALHGPHALPAPLIGATSRPFSLSGLGAGGNPGESVLPADLVPLALLRSPPGKAGLNAVQCPIYLALWPGALGLDVIRGRPGQAA